MKRISFVFLCAAILMAEPALVAPDAADEQLHDAISQGLTDEVRRLLEAGADVNAGDTDGNTALHHAARHNDLEIARLLLEAGADVNLLNDALLSPLGHAEVFGQMEVLRLLLGGDADLDLKNALGKRFELYSRCEPMRIGVILQNGDEVVQGLTEEDIQAAVESRLRAARLYDSDANSYLFFHVHLMDISIGEERVGWVYSTEVSYNKSVQDEASGQRRFASTWGRANVGVTSSAESVGESILGNVRGYMDQFLAEYLRVNEKACKQNPVAQQDAQ